MDLGTSNVDISSSPSLACEKIESSHTLQRLCTILCQGHIQPLYKFDSLLPALSQGLLARCVMF